MPVGHDPVGRRGVGVRAAEARRRREEWERLPKGERPARGYRWEPFGPGNRAAVRHGAKSEVLVSERAGAVAEALFEQCPWMVDVDRQAIDRFCRLEARAQMLHEYVMRVAEEVGIEHVRSSVLTEATRADMGAQKAAQDLGLDPTGRARVLKDLGWARQLSQGSVGALAERGAKLRALRSAEGQAGAS